MIITSPLALEVNKIYTKPFGYYTPQNKAWINEFTFYVLRQATMNEYIEYCIKEGCREEMLRIANYFYEISTD